MAEGRICLEREHAETALFYLARTYRDVVRTDPEDPNLCTVPRHWVGALLSISAALGISIPDELRPFLRPAEPP